MTFHCQLVRSSSGCYPTFNLPMGSSPGFGSITPDSRPIKTRFPFGFASLGLTSPDTITRRLINQKARGHAFALPLLVSTRFQVLFHSPHGVLFTFPSRYFFTIGQQVVFSLGVWSPQIPAGFLVPHSTQVHNPEELPAFAYRAFTFFGPASQLLQLTVRFSRLPRSVSRLCPSTPDQQRLRTSTLTRFGLLPFRSPLLRESLRFLFLRLLRCFTSPGSPPLPLGREYLASLQGGFPHSGTRGSTVACTSPRLFAACHALLRLLLPRHPPCALITFTSFPFSSLPYALFKDLNGLTQRWIVVLALTP